MGASLGAEPLIGKMQPATQLALLREWVSEQSRITSKESADHLAHNRMPEAYERAGRSEAFDQTIACMDDLAGMVRP